MPIVLDEPRLTYGSGAVGVALPGSRQVVPTSLLTTAYEVNGLILNARQNLEHYWIKSIGGLYDSEVRDGRELNVDRDGETYYGGLYAGKPLVIDGFIYAQSLAKLEDMEFALAEAFDPLDEEYQFIGRTGDFERDWMLWVTKTASLDIKQEQTSMQFKRPFLITLRSSRPSIFSYQLHSASLNLNDGMQVEVTNKGSREADPRILLFGSTSTVTINNPATGQTFRLTGNIPAGRYYAIDFEAGTITDDLGVNKFDQYDPTSDWLKLAKRSSQMLEITAAIKSPASSATIYWRDTSK